MGFFGFNEITDGNGFRTKQKAFCFSQLTKSFNYADSFRSLTTP